MTANGRNIVVDKEIELNVELDGQPVTIKLSELPVQCPLLSVGNVVKRGNTVVFQDQEDTSFTKLLVERSCLLE